MARFNGLLNNFGGGEISPRLRHRSDLDGFAGATEHQKNFYSDYTGEMSFRPGSKFRATGIYGHDFFRLVPFVYDSNTSYILEFSTNSGGSNPLMRVFNADGNVDTEALTAVIGVEKRLNQLVIHINTGTPTTWGTTRAVHIGNISATNSTVIRTITNSGYTQFNYQSFVISARNASGFAGATHELVIDVPGLTASAAEAATGGAFIYAETTVASPFVSADVYSTLQWSQKDNVMMVASGEYQLQQVARTGGTPNWVLSNFAMIDASSAAIFASAGNYPKTVAFHEGRLCLANTDNDPDTVWGSQSGIYNTFDWAAGSPTAATGIRVTLGSTNDEVVGMESTKDFLYLQTLGGGHYIDGGGVGTAITTATINTRKIHNVGSTLTTPLIRFDEDILFIERGGRKLRVMEYNFDRGKYIPQDISRHADHICSSGLKLGAIARGSTDRIYMATSKHAAVLTYDTTTNTNAWNRYVVGGLQAEDSLAKNIINRVIDVASVPYQFATSDTVLFLCYRDGGHYLESRFISPAYGDEEQPYMQKEDIDIGSETDDLEQWNWYRLLYQREDIYSDSAILINNVNPYAFTLGSAAVGSTTLTSGSALFSASDVGRRILEPIGFNSIGEQASYGVAEITAYNSSTSVDIEVLVAFSTTTFSASELLYETDAMTIAFPALQGATSVRAVVDGTDVGDIAVPSSGVVSIPYMGSTFILGFPYRGLVKTTNLQGGGTSGPSDGKLKTIPKAIVKFRQTNRCKIGSSRYNTEDLVFSSDDDPMDEPTPYLDGEKEIKFSGSWDTEKHIWIIKDDASPCIISRIVPWVETSND